ncbi:hypothetical protein FC66_GL000345 [Dellaglioa algida DSM 15638]|uniref:Uncharacterized protein n=1 Tax=Dellaglioa algida DSM 15638 TaxID=1423719 RepID=A0A0R1HQ58_9LACO|nr:hypothetical protein FC66_GL000345 [Dellaglioa algida DSM 15638]
MNSLSLLKSVKCNLILIYFFIVNVAKVNTKKGINHSLIYLRLGIAFNPSLLFLAVNMFSPCGLSRKLVILNAFFPSISFASVVIFASFIIILLPETVYVPAGPAIFPSTVCSTLLSLKVYVFDLYVYFPSKVFEPHAERVIIPSTIINPIIILFFIYSLQTLFKHTFFLEVLPSKYILSSKLSSISEVNFHKKFSIT